MTEPTAGDTQKLKPVPSPSERYADLVEIMRTQPGVVFGQPGKKGFGASALWANGRIFAMLSHDRLVVKLSARRVDILIATGEAERFDPGHGRQMKEWFSLFPASDLQWQDLAQEALSFALLKS